MESEAGSPENTPLQPVPGSFLFDREVARRNALQRQGNIFSGCGELDEHALLGGFERGSVVGISAEDEEVGLVIGLQTIARLLLPGDVSAPKPRAAIVTTMGYDTLLPILRNVCCGQLGVSSTNDVVLDMFERISISRVFDLEGVSEVLDELASQGAYQGSSPTVKLGEEKKDDGAIQNLDVQEIQDSEDDDALSPPQPQTPETNPSPPRLDNSPATQAAHGMPDIVLVANMSSLLMALFNLREESFALDIVQLLSPKLRSLSRSGPLVMVLNSTTSPLSRAARYTEETDTYMPTGRRSMDPSLCSMFHTSLTASGHFDEDAPPKLKPSFGLIFTQLLDLHLLCTRVSRTARDAELAPPAPAHRPTSPFRSSPSSSPPTSGYSTAAGSRFVWVVEVLQDDMGVWEMVVPRRSRERKWGTVDVENGTRIVDAFGCV